MRITNIKSKTKSLEFIQAKLSVLLYKSGYNVELFIINKSRIDIKGPHRGKGPQMLAYTYNINIGCFNKGYRRCHKPTWDQYVTLNHLINDFLDKHKISASIKSMEFKVRDKDYGRENDWDQPYWVCQNQHNGFGPVLETETEAVEYVAKFKQRKVA